MQPITCPACGHEFETPELHQAGPACPRCGEPVAWLAGRWPPAVAVETYVMAAVGGAALGLVAAGVLLLSRW
jgi:uncharacterized paraquat-inducible protein A